MASYVQNTSGAWVIRSAPKQSRAKVAAHVFNLNKLEMPDLLSLAPEIRKKVLARGAYVIAIEARKTAPDSGYSHKNKLNKSITFRSRNNGLAMAVVVKAPHSHLVHDGTRAHPIAPKTLESARRGYRFYGGTMNPVQHPGSRSQPFLTDAGESQRPKVEQVMRERAIEVLELIARKT
jgi:HK97 gp10 family phage protein